MSDVEEELNKLILSHIQKRIQRFVSDRCGCTHRTEDALHVSIMYGFGKFMVYMSEDGYLTVGNGILDLYRTKPNDPHFIDRTVDHIKKMVCHIHNTPRK